jgi:hypothetical protein
MEHVLGSSPSVNWTVISRIVYTWKELPKVNIIRPMAAQTAPAPPDHPGPAIPTAP